MSSKSQKGSQKQEKQMSQEQKPVDFESPASGKIFLDKEGRWFHEGVEITHPRTIELFSRSVVKDPSGGYRLQIGKEWAKIEVEDTPYMVRSLEIKKDKIILILNDKSQEELDPTTLWLGKDNVLYCKVKNGEYPARFLRPAYYQIMQFLEEDEKGFFLSLKREKFYLQRKNNL